MNQLKRDLGRRGWLGVALAALLAIYGNTCGKSPVDPSRSVPTGSWGGTSIALNVTAEGAAVQFDCAHGTITGSPMTIDASGKFDVTGTYVREHGGPTRLDETPDSHPARYSGTTDGRTMSLTITLTDSQQTLGPFDLGFGRAPRLFKCQ
jgi:hypothetical protein